MTATASAPADEPRSTSEGNGVGAAVPAPDEEPSPARMEAFSDGVFSIIITLLALDLRVPARLAPLSSGDGTSQPGLSDDVHRAHGVA